MKAKLQMIASMVIYGTLPWFVSKIPLPTPQIALFRAAVALVCILAFQWARGRRLRLAGLGRDGLKLFLSGAAMGFNWIFLFEAYRYTSKSVATLCYYFAPCIVMLAIPALFHQRVTRLQALCFLGSTAGLALVVIAGGSLEGSDHARGVALGLAAAALYAGVMLLNMGITRVSGIDRTVLQFAAAAATLLIYVLATGGLTLGAMDVPGWLSLAAVGVIHTGVAYVLYFSAIKALPGQETAILSYIDPLVAVVVSVTLLGDPFIPLQLLGGALILGCTLYNELAGK